MACFLLGDLRNYRTCPAALSLSRQTGFFLNFVHIVVIIILQQVYGVYAEEQWCELCLKGEGDAGDEFCYLHKLTGSMQVGGRPQDFRPSLQV